MKTTTNPAGSIYPITLHFTQTFTKGNLEGITIENTMPFCSDKDAHEWAAGINRNNKHGSCDYMVK